MELTVARAVFVTGLLKSDADAPEVRRDDANVFVKTLLRTVNICTAANVKTCKAFIMRFIMSSAARTAVLIKFLTTVARSCTPHAAGRTAEDNEGLPDDGAQRTVSSSYRCLHVLYIIHDLVCFATIKPKKDARHAELLKIDATARENLVQLLKMLAQLAVCADGNITHASQQMLIQVENLLREWKRYSIISGEAVNTLQKDLELAHASPWQELLVKLADGEAQAAMVEHKAREEATRWLIPKTNHLPHDPNAEWHELPATNGFFQKQTHGYPLRAAAFPPGGYSLERGGQYADEETRRTVETLLDDVKHCFDKYTNPEEVEDIDALGNIVWKAETGRKRRNHWGWSYEGIEKRRRQLAERS